MPLRRILSTVHAYLVEKYGRDAVDEWLAEKLDHEMTDRERKTAAYRRRAKEIGADTGQQQLMQAFQMGGR